MNESTTPQPAKPQPSLAQKILGGLILSVPVVLLVGALSGTDDTTMPTPAAAAPIVVDAVAAPPAPPAGPATSVSNGTHLVGTDIEPGTYRSDGPLRTQCYWARLSGTGGELDDIIANNLGRGPATVTIKKGDEAFESAGCARWHKAR